VATELELKGVYRFDRRRRRITAVELAIKEKRAIGHVGPGLDVVAKLKLRITPRDATPGTDPERLAESALPEDTAPALGLLYESQRGHFRLTYDRRWYVTADAPTLVVFRLIDRGDLIAQCRVSPLTGKSPDRQISLEKFQKDVRYSLGEHFGQFVQATQWRDSKGSHIYRVRVRGEVKKLPVEWRYYLVAHASGRRVAMAFTVEQSLTKRFGDADQRLVETLAVAPAGAGDRLDTAAQPIPVR
jgi:hypothetical protein